VYNSRKRAFAEQGIVEFGFKETSSPVYKASFSILKGGA
jgi:hypothetical protein